MSVFVNSYYNIEDLHISESDKSKFEYLKKGVDYYITSLVNEKPRIRTARNLYDGVRDKAEFKYLEETFGIETPIAVKMTPLIKTRIDALLGLLLDETFTFKVTVNDATTLTKIEKQRLAIKAKKILQGYDKQVADNAKRVEEGGEAKGDVVTDKYLEGVSKLINEDFISNFEIAAQSLIQFFNQDRTIEFKQKIKQYFLDLLLTGEGYYRTYITKLGADPVFEICKPENIFFSKNTSHQFMSSGHKPNVFAVVHRTFMKRTEILSRWGHKMNDTAKSQVFGDYSEGNQRITDPRQLDYIYREEGEGKNDIHNQHTNSDLDTLPVYFVEWLANNEIKLEDNIRDDQETTESIKSSKYYNKEYGKNPGSGAPNKKGYRLDRYEGVRIGDDLYIDMGKSKFIPRSLGDPASTVLSINGCAYNDRNGTPYSTALALKGVQDSYDVVTFFRDNLIASSGVGGSRINLAAIPKVLGQDYMERLLKFMAFRKQGVELYDPTEEGANLFSGYGDYKGTLDGGFIQDLNLVLESLERQADVTSGINRHMYQAAEVRDAVKNVRIGQQQVSLLTKDLFELVNTTKMNALGDLINRSKVTYKKGKRGSYIVGEKQIMFDVQPENFAYSDFNIHVSNGVEEAEKIQKVIDMIPELVGMGALGPDVLVKIAMSSSPTAIVKYVDEGMKSSKKEKDELGQLGQQVEQLTGQIKEYESAMAEHEKQVKALTDASDRIKIKEIEILEHKVKEKAKIDRDRLTREGTTVRRECYRII